MDYPDQAPLSIEIPFMNGLEIDNTLNLHLTSGLLKDPMRHPQNYNTGLDSPSWHTLHPWPGELSDAMMWSAQFLDPTKVTHHDDASGSAPDVLKDTPSEDSGHGGHLF